MEFFFLFQCNKFCIVSTIVHVNIVSFHVSNVIFSILSSIGYCDHRLEKYLMYLSLHKAMFNNSYSLSTMGFRKIESRNV